MGLTEDRSGDMWFDGSCDRMPLAKPLIFLRFKGTNKYVRCALHLDKEQ